MHRNQTYLEYNLLGVFLLDKEGKIIDERLFPNNPDTIAQNIINLDNGILISQLSDLLNSHQGEGEYLSTSYRILVGPIEKEYEIQVNVDDSSRDFPSLRNVLPELTQEKGFIPETADFGAFSHSITTALSRKLVSLELIKKEALISPTVQLLGELDVMLNNLAGRLREWYGIHFPELGNRVSEHSDYAQLVSVIGRRDDFTEDALMRLSVTRKDIDRITKSADTSMGAPLDDIDLSHLQNLAKHYLDIERYREQMSEYIGMLVEESAPNVAYLAGPVLGGKLIDKAGGLRRLAMMSSSTIQILGAEKAMFRALKTNAKPPKHGLLFQHPYVHNAPRRRRGSRARSLAAKIAIAARADEFSGNFIAEELSAQLTDAE